MDQQILMNMWGIMREYDLEVVGEMSEDYKCGICKKTLINACNPPCGCRFCNECITDFLKKGKRECPGQSELCSEVQIDIDTDIFHNRAINSRISKLTTKCPNIDCQSQFELKSLENHLITCENKSQSYPFINVESERNFLSNNRVEDQISSHSRFMINWMNNFEKEIELLKKENYRLKEKIRIDKDKTEKILQDLQKKENKNSAEIDLLNEEMCTLKNEYRSVKGELQTLKVDQIQQNITVSTKIDQFKQQFEMAETRYDKIYDFVEKRKAQLDNVSPNIDTSKNESIENNRLAGAQLAEKIIDPPDIRLKMSHYIWKIDNWTDKVKEAQNSEDVILFESDDFLSHPNGYKLCLSVDIDEYYLCFAFCILRGEFDDILKWPFNLDVKVDLINQQTGLAFKTRRLKSFNKLNDERFKKPMSDKNKSITIDYLIIPVAQISANPALSENNQIFVKFVLSDKHNKSSSFG